MLLSGPSGTGKTLMAKAFATESGLNFITVDGAGLLSKWVGESEKTLRQIFKKAKQASPCLLFFDGLDTLAPVRRDSDSAASERLVGQFLSELDGLNALDEIIVLGATNRIDLVDSSLLRPGRFDFVLDFPLPDLHARREIFLVHLDRTPLSANVDVEELAVRSDGLSGADIEAVCQRAGMGQMRRFIDDSKGDPSPPVDQYELDQEYLRNALAEIVRFKAPRA